MTVWEIIDKRTGRRMISLAYASRKAAADQIKAWHKKDGSPDVAHFEPRPLRIRLVDVDA